MLQSCIRKKTFLTSSIFKLSNYISCYSSLTSSNGHSINNVSALEQAINGLEFKVISRGSGTIMSDFIREYFCNPILSSSENSSLGGEKVLATLNATSEHPSSFFLMYFQGSQDKHYHGGPRLLNIFANKPWYLYAGGTDLSVLQKDKIPVAKITFPGNSYTQVRFAPNFIHGFEGEDFAAISNHYTDIQEMQSKKLSLKNSLLNNEKVLSSTLKLTSVAHCAFKNDKDIMTKLTIILPEKKIKLIVPEISCDNILR